MAGTGPLATRGTDERNRTAEAPRLNEETRQLLPAIRERERENVPSAPWIPGPVPFARLLALHKYRSPTLDEY